MGRLKNAPLLAKANNSNSNALDEFFILAGAGVWEFYRDKAKQNGAGEGWRLLCDIFKMPYSEQPSALTDEQLENLSQYHIAPSNRQIISIIECNELTQAQRTTISLNLARNTRAKTVVFRSIAGEILENVSGYVERLRNDKEVVAQAEMIAPEEIDLNSSAVTEEMRVNAFLKWHAEPLARDTHKNQTLKYNGRFWEPLQDEDVKRLILDFFKAYHADYSINRINKLCELINLSIDRFEHTSNKYLGFNNGVLNKLTLDFEAHKPEHYLKGVEDVECNIQATDTPHFFNWLDFVSNGNQEKRNALLAGLYMVLTNRYEWHLFLEITGVGGSGKSVYSEIARMINGEFNTAYLTLEDLESDKKRSMLINKSLSISPDQKRYKGSGEELKAITGGGKISVKINYKDPFDALLTPVIMVVTNEPLIFTDRNGGD
ncbi:DUF5906 domain-containing protein [Caviibacterium pharyngocola]|uniref:SF3 helicase domain-containing protein n=1 Tax=Caviibacterium pharyngocola TaxID=28159 RepID=A0A2M8RSV6_9PAST|nr:DUF5906 domain-containing protein [Caviibacterium pharyngocola]PJG81974.1 hypothetical protein CVP04_11375 [Caviibacterium pharyngocola]